MKVRKINGIMKVAAVSALSLGLFSAAFVGANHFAFVSATGGITPLDVAAATPLVAQATANTPQTTQNNTSTEATDFTPPSITVIQGEIIESQPIPSAAITMEEAALIGAKYIYDVFGSSIDGMYVEMMYTLTPGFTRPTWLGSVHAEMPVQPDFEAIRNAADAGNTMVRMEVSWVPSVYSFRIDALTGMRVDVSYLNPSFDSFDQMGPRLSAEEALEQRRQIMYPSETMINFFTRWFEMSAKEQLELTDITPERLEHYRQQAHELAQRHFNMTTVQNVELGDAWSSGSTFVNQVMEYNGRGEFNIIVGAITFTATDNTGREAIVRIPTENGSWHSVSVNSMHNDFIPGFSYDRPGRG